MKSKYYVQSKIYIVFREFLDFFILIPNFKATTPNIATKNVSNSYSNSEIIKSTPPPPDQHSSSSNGNEISSLSKIDSSNTTIFTSIDRRSTSSSKQQKVVVVDPFRECYKKKTFKFYFNILLFVNIVYFFILTTIILI